jgi:hypothetical protein
MVNLSVRPYIAQRARFEDANDLQMFLDHLSQFRVESTESGSYRTFGSDLVSWDFHRLALVKVQ